MKGKHLNTRISPRAYQALLRKCADGNCTPYEYVRQLIHVDVGLDVDGETFKDVPQEPFQTELNKKDEHIEGRIRITG